MKLTKQEQDIVRRKFSKYCIEVLNGEALNYLEELDRLWEQEINFSDLGESILNQFCSYDEIPESDYFQIMGMEVPVRDEAISNSMQLSMLKQLLSKKLISENEYQIIQKKLMKDYGIISNITA